MSEDVISKEKLEERYKKVIIRTEETVLPLREKAPYVLNRKGHSEQKKKLLKEGKRLKKYWSSYASWECCTIAELKEAEHVGHRMKGGHRHRRNYCICNVCGHWFRKNKGVHDECSDGPLHFCSGGCDRQAQYEASLEADVGGGFVPHYWDDDEDAEWRRKNEKV